MIQVVLLFVFILIIPVTDLIIEVFNHNNGEIIFHRGAIPTVIFGPGNEKFAHKADECVEIEKLVASVPVFMSIFHKLLG